MLGEKETGIEKDHGSREKKKGRKNVTPIINRTVLREPADFKREEALEERLVVSQVL